MLIIANNRGKLHFSQLMAVYEEGNRENGAEFWPELPEYQQILNAENEFFQYLQEVFFARSDAVYCILEQNGKYVSALRLEPYKDGLLLEALETAPGHRRCGYGRKLIQAVLEQYGDQKIYSHVSKRNLPSLRIHETCAFQRILEYAVYVDGSVNRRSCTFLYQK